jgi:hypothetical protein
MAVFWVVALCSLIEVYLNESECCELISMPTRIITVTNCVTFDICRRPRSQVSSAAQADVTTEVETWVMNSQGYP